MFIVIKIWKINYKRNYLGALVKIYLIYRHGSKNMCNALYEMHLILADARKPPNTPLIKVRNKSSL